MTHNTSSDNVKCVCGCVLCVISNSFSLSINYEFLWFPQLCFKAIFSVQPEFQLKCRLTRLFYVYYYPILDKLKVTVEAFMELL